ncbi:glycosyltransferase family 2 protein [Mycoplasma sp. 613B]
MKNKLSILIPCFNKNKYYKRVFKCLIKQTDKRFDLVFLNDSSTDNTLEILNEFKNKYDDLFNIKIINLEKNGGLANARNILINNCDTEYFLFLDPDDLITKNAIFEFNKPIYSSHKYDIITAHFSLIFKNIPILNLAKTKILTKPKYKNNIEYTQDQLAFIWNKAINRDWFLNLDISFLVGYNYEDFPISFISLLSTINSYHINKKTYKYDLNLQGLSKKHNIKKIVSITKNLDFLYSELKKRNIFNVYKENIEKYFIRKVFTHIFWAHHNLNKENEFQIVLIDFYNILEKYQIDERIIKYKTKFFSLFNIAFSNYEKLRYKKYNLENLQKDFNGNKE